MKNYYEILGVSKTAEHDEIRRQYRKLAMKYHPDQNPDDDNAESKFKEIAEAYGVLTDPVKRKEYDLHLASGGSQDNYQSGFSYSQEDILKDLFRDPRFQQMFQGLLREFQRSGLRSSPHFLKKSFFGGKGGVFMGGIFLFGSLAGPALLKGGRKAMPGGKSVLKSLGKSVGNLLSMRQEKDTGASKNLDVIFQTPLSRQELKRGKVTEVVTYGEKGMEVLKVKIPPGSRAGQKLRLKGKGKKLGKHRRGDLFLQLCEKE